LGETWISFKFQVSRFKFQVQNVRDSNAAQITQNALEANLKLETWNLKLPEHVRMSPHSFTNPSVQETTMAEITIRATKNGPYIVEGPVELFDTEGNKIVVDKPRIALCRCGASSNKPFCDGTHSKIGFQAAEAINPASAE
jgi:CDGSH-type Zn-finger protein